MSGSFVNRSGVCIRTMHSAKGLQWRAVLVMRCDMMPFLAGPSVDRAEQERLEARINVRCNDTCRGNTCFHPVNLERLRISDPATSRPRRCEGTVGNRDCISRTTAAFRPRLPQVPDPRWERCATAQTRPGKQRLPTARFDPVRVTQTPASASTRPPSCVRERSDRNPRANYSIRPRFRPRACSRFGKSID